MAIQPLEIQTIVDYAAITGQKLLTQLPAAQEVLSSAIYQEGPMVIGVAARGLLDEGLAPKYVVDFLTKSIDQAHPLQDEDITALLDNRRQRYGSSIFFTAANIVVGIQAKPDDAFMLTFGIAGDMLTDLGYEKDAVRQLLGKAASNLIHIRDSKR